MDVRGRSLRRELEITTLNIWQGRRYIQQHRWKVRRDKRCMSGWYSQHQNKESRLPPNIEGEIFRASMRRKLRRGRRWIWVSTALKQENKQKRQLFDEKVVNNQSVTAPPPHSPSPLWPLPLLYSSSDLTCGI